MSGKTVAMRLSMYRLLVKALGKGLICSYVKRSLGDPESTLTNRLNGVWLVSHYRRGREICYGFDFLEMLTLIIFLIEKYSTRVILGQDDRQSAA